MLTTEEKFLRLQEDEKFYCQKKQRFHHGNKTLNHNKETMKEFDIKRGVKVILFIKLPDS